MTAQEAFRLLLKEHLGPALRAEGLTGSGRSWAVPSDTHHAVLGWQKGRGSDRDAVTFTANAKVVARSTWFAQDHPPGRLGIGRRPEPSTSYGLAYGVTWERRVGQLAGVRGGDLWWSVGPHDDVAAVAAPVLEVVRGTVLPALHEQLAQQRATSPLCEANVGYRNLYRHCAGRPDVALAVPGRRAFLCAAHAAGQDHEVLATFPDLLRERPPSAAGRRRPGTLPR